MLPDRESVVAFTQPLVESRLLKVFTDLLDARGCDSSALLAKVGIDASAVADSKSMISVLEVGLLLDEAAAVLGDPALGVNLGQDVPPGFSGLLGQLMLASPTVRDMLVVCVRYTGVHIRFARADFEDLEGGIGQLSWIDPPSYEGPRIHLNGFFMSVLVARIRTGAGAAWQPLATQFVHGAPAGLKRYQEVFGPRLRFEQDKNALLVDPTALSRPMPPQVVTPDMYSSFLDLGKRVQDEAELAPGIVGSVRSAIAARLEAGGGHDLDAISRMLDMPTRSLQYRLEQAGTSFERVLSDTRRLLAERFLRDSDLSMGEIAARIGFAEQSVFTRAAQKWFEMTPRAYRQKLRGDPRPPRAGQS